MEILKSNSIFYFLSISIILARSLYAQEPVLKNPGLSSSYYMEIRDHLDTKRGFVTSKVSVTLNTENNKKYYIITAREGNYYKNQIKLNFNNLTSLSENRIDLKSGDILESYKYLENNVISFYNKEENINKKF